MFRRLLSDEKTLYRATDARGVHINISSLRSFLLGQFWGTRLFWSILTSAASRQRNPLPGCWPAPTHQSVSFLSIFSSLVHWSLAQSAISTMPPETRTMVKLLPTRSQSTTFHHSLM